MFIPERTLIVPGADRPIPGGVPLPWSGPCFGFGPDYPQAIAVDAYASDRGDWYVEFHPADVDGYPVDTDPNPTPIIAPLNVFLIACGLVD